MQEIHDEKRIESILRQESKHFQKDRNQSTCYNMKKENY